MTTLAEAFVKVGFDNSGLSSGLSAAKSSITSWAGSAIGVAAGVGAAIGAAFALKEMVTAAMEGEVAANQLAAAFRGVGADIDAEMESFGRVAAEIQAVTTVGDEATAELYRFGLSLGVPTSNLENTTKAAIGLGRAFNIDHSTVMKAMAKETQGVASNLEKYIPALKGVTDTEQRLAIIREAANRGLIQEQAFTQTLSGAWTQFQNALGDTAEAMGGFLVPALTAVVGLMNEFIPWVQNLIANIQNASYETTNMSATWNMLLNAWSGTGGIATALSEIWVATIQVLVSGIDWLFGVINEGIFLFSNFDLVAQSAWLSIKEGAVNAAITFATFFENLGIGVSWLYENYTTIWMNTFNTIITIISNFGSNVMNFMSELWDWMISLGDDPIEVKFKPLTEGATTQELDPPKFKEYESTTMFDEEKANLANEWDKRRVEFEKAQEAQPAKVKPQLEVSNLAATANIEADKKAAEERQKGLEKENDMKAKWAKDDAIAAEKERLEKDKKQGLARFEGAGSFQGLGDGFKNASKNLADANKNREAERQTKIQEQLLQAFQRSLELQENAKNYGLT